MTTKLFQPTAQLKISLTPDCNNDCPICLNKTTRSRNGRGHQLTTDKIKGLIDEASSLGMIGTYWSGGEPLMEFESLVELINYSSEKGMISTIVTNGGLMGAFGNYKKMNEEILKKAGLSHLSTTEIVESLKEAGLGRIYFSIDSNHTTLDGADSGIYNAVPTEVVAKVIRAFLDEGFGKVHRLEAIGHQLRVSATTSGLWDAPTNEILEDVMKKIGVTLKKELSPTIKIYGNTKSNLLLKKLAVANLGDAEDLDEDFLEDRNGEGLFDIECSHFTSRGEAYDEGKYHGDLYIDYNGIVYTCGNHAYPIGNVFTESLTSIIEGINTPTERGPYASTRAVFHTLLSLAQDQEIGKKAIGEAIRLIYNSNPHLTKALKTQCGSCNCLGNQTELQEVLLKNYRDRIS